MLTKNIGFVSDVLQPLDVKQNVVVFGRRNLGKTEFFFDCFLRLAPIFDGKIFIIDSATEHKEKSLIKKIQRYYEKTIFSGSFVLCKDNVPDFFDENNQIRDEKIYLIDAAKFLEESFRLSDKERCAITREKYKKFVEKFILAIDATFDKYLIFMDEIELTRNAASVLSRAKGGCAFFSIVHDIFYVEGLKNFVLINADRMLIDCFHKVPKSPKQLCGNACAEIVSALFYTRDGHANVDLFWCTDIASYLAKKGIKIEVLCWNSNLYNDYIKYDYRNFVGFTSLKRYEDTIQPILQKPLTYEQLLFELDENKCVICCVSSSIFNDSVSLVGGHYIVVYKDDGAYYCLTPKKNLILREVKDLGQIANACSEYGSWRILCN